MDAEVKAPLKVIRVWGKRAILRSARKEHKCAASGLPIEKGKDYYCVYHTGATFGAPNYGVPFGAGVSVQVRCINDYLNFGGKYALTIRK